MRTILLALVGLSFVVGCASRKDTKTDSPQTGPATIRSINVISGKIVLVNATLRYVVVDFSLASEPKIDQQFNVYRKGQKVGVVKISAQARSNTVAADIVEGYLEAGDEVKSD